MGTPRKSAAATSLPATPPSAPLGRWRRHLLHRIRLMTAVTFGVLVALLLPTHEFPRMATRVLLGWNAGALLYLVLAGLMMWRSGTSGMRRRAQIEDEGRWAVLVLVTLGTLAALGAIGWQLREVHDLPLAQKAGHVALAGLTVFTAWAFTQTIFALHYAHEFYFLRGQKCGDALQFPGTPDPGYADFLYFSCVIGTSAQTADVAFTHARVRRIGLLHCVLCFFFNTTVLALTINIAAGLM
jgi:uncharacterized membrane protein